MDTLSTIQEGILLTQHIYRDSPLYNVGGYAVVEGALNEQALAKAITGILDDSDVIVTGFAAFNPTEHMPAGTSPYEIEIADLTDKADAVIYFEEWMQHDIRLPFDVGRSLVKVVVARVSASCCYWYTKAHHLIMDGYSMALLFDKVSALYAGAASQDDISARYVDFIRTDAAYRLSSEYENDKKFWIERLNGQSAGRAFYSCLKQDGLGRLTAMRRQVVLDRALFDMIEAFSKNYNCTAFHYFLALLFVLNRLYNNPENTIIGVPVFNRGTRPFKRTLGTFVNVLPLSVQVTDKDSFIDILLRVKDELKKCYRHQRFPFYEILREIDGSGNVYNMTFSYQKNHYENNILNTQARITYLHPGEQQEDLSFHLLDYSPSAPLTLCLDYRSDLFSPAVAEGLLTHFSHLSASLLTDYNQPLSRLDYLTTVEKHILVSAFNDTSADYPVEKTITGIFEEQVALTPNREAVRFGDKALSYQELNELSNRLAVYLRNRYYVCPNDLVGVLLEKSEWMIVVLLGILKAGAGYVPIDPGYPADRIDYMIEDSACKVVIDEAALTVFRNVAATCSSNNPVQCNNAGDVSYVIYTSGSTGLPKGCIVTHGNVVRLLKTDRPLFDFNATDVWTMFHSYCFDFSVWEMYGALLFGGKLVVVPAHIARDPSAFADLLRREEVTVLNQTPSSFYNLTGEELRRNDHSLKIRYVIFGGEALSPARLASWHARYPAAQLINMYGITETTVHVTFKVLTPGDIVADSRVIGRPIPTLTCYVLDPYGRLLPPGVTGELYVGGDGVSRGYLNRETLTQQRFLDSPFRYKERLYRSGDKARMLENGELEYFGRLDEQVKIRGYRIELGEIERALQEHATVETVVVIARASDDGDNELIAYLTGNTVPDAVVLRAHLSTRLPAYMLPAHYVYLDRLPLTSNGKVDKKKLPEPGNGSDGRNEYVAPRNGIEERLIMIWEEILNKTGVGVLDNFFESGGQSLRAARLAGQIGQRFGVKINLKDIFERPVLAEQADLIASAAPAQYMPIPAVAEQASYPLSSAQRRLWILSRFQTASAAYNMAGAYVFEGRMDRDVLEQSFALLIARHEMLRTVFREQDGVPRQVVIPTASYGFNIRYRDLQNSARQEEDIRMLVNGDAKDVFDLANGPLLRAGLYQLTDNRWIFTCTMHHIISDGWSMGILIRELLAAYEAGIRGEDITFKPLRIQYKDFAAWQQAQLSGEGANAQQTYWLQQFAGELPVLEMPSDKVRPPIKSYNGSIVDAGIPDNVVTRLRSLCQEKDATLFMGLLSVVNILLYSYSEQEDIIIGTPVAGRGHIDLEDQIGFYINTLALRTRFNGTDSFHDVLLKVRKVALDAYQHQSYPIDRLIEELDLQRDLSRHPLFDVQVIVQNDDISSKMQIRKMGELTVNELKPDIDGSSKFDLSFIFTETENGIAFSIAYNSDIFSRENILEMTRNFDKVLAEMLDQPDTPLDHLLEVNLTADTMSSLFTTSLSSDF
jgi:amino acid adenylation domain-containing protein